MASAAPAAAGFRQPLGLLAAKAEPGHERAKAQVEHHGPPARPIQAAQQQRAQDAGMHPTRAREQGQALGHGDQRRIDQQREGPVLQPITTEQNLKLQHPQQARARPTQHRPQLNTTAPASVALP